MTHYRLPPLLGLAAALALTLSACTTHKTAPDPAQSTFTNPAPSLMPTTQSTVPPTVGEVH